MHGTVNIKYFTTSSAVVLNVAGVHKAQALGHWVNVAGVHKAQALGHWATEFIRLCRIFVSVSECGACFISFFWHVEFSSCP